MADSSARLIAYQRRATIPVFIATLCVVPVLIFEGSSNSAWATAARIRYPASYGALASMSGVVSSVCGPFSVQTAYVDRYIETPAYSPLTLKA